MAEWMRAPRRLVPGLGSVLTPDAFNNGGERHRGLISGKRSYLPAVGIVREAETTGMSII